MLAPCSWRQGWKPSQLVVPAIYAAVFWNVGWRRPWRKWGKGQVRGLGSAPLYTAPTCPLCFYSAGTDWIQDGPGCWGFRAGKWESRESSGGILLMAVGKGDQC